MTAFSATHRTLARRTIAGLALAVATIGAVQSAPADATTDAAATTIRPGQLDRGEGPAVPVVLGTVILHGDRMVEVDARYLRLLGTSGDDYVAEVHDSDGSRVERISPDGTRTAITQRVRGWLELSQDGDVLYDVLSSGHDSLVRARDAVTGEVEHRLPFGAPLTVVGADGDTAILSADGPDVTYRWDLDEPDVLEKLAGKASYDADVRGDRYVTGSGQGEDFCTQVRSLSSPRRIVWSTCDHTVLELQTDTGRLIAGPSYLDGPISTVTLRAPRGRELVELGLARRAWFGPTVWEDADHVLAEVQTPDSVSWVRCDVEGACERASDIEANPYVG